MFLPVLGFDGYEISIDGNLRSKGRILKKRYLRGYVKYCLYQNKGPHYRSAHRLVWEAFVGPIPEGLQINHLDGNRDNNHLSNLEVCTFAENMAHRAKHLNVIGVRGVASNLARLSEEQARLVISLGKQGLSQSKIASAVGTSRPNVSMILSGKTWPHLER